MKTSKIPCTTCRQEFEIPEGKIPKNLEETAIICPYCMRLGMKGVHPDDLEEQMKLKRDEITADMLCDRTTEAFTEHEFPQFWKTQKEDLKEPSKKELARKAFSTGANALLWYLMRTQKNDREHIMVLRQMEELLEQAGRKQWVRE